MNRLRSYSHSLREVFETTVTARYIASSLVSFDAERTALKIQAVMKKQEFDEIGVRENGVVSGYARQEQLVAGRVGLYQHRFDEADVVSADLPLLETLRLVRDRRRVFVNVLGQVNGIVTRSDVVKPPVRLWLYGLLTIFEMQLTRLIKRRFPDEGWAVLVDPAVIKKAKYLQKKRKEHGTDVDLADCLVLGEKHRVLIKSPEIRNAMGFVDTDDAKKALASIEALRNPLSHAHDISPQWPSFLETASEIDEAIRSAEQVSSRELMTLSAH